MKKICLLLVLLPLLLNAADEGRRINDLTWKAANFCNAKNYPEAQKLYLQLASDPAVDKASDQAYFRFRAAYADAESHLKNKRPADAKQVLSDALTKEYSLLEGGRKAESAVTAANLLRRLDDLETAEKLLRDTAASFAPDFRPDIRYIAEWNTILRHLDRMDDAYAVCKTSFPKYLADGSRYNLEQFVKHYITILNLCERSGEIADVCRQARDSRKTPADKNVFSALLAEQLDVAGKKTEAASAWREAGNLLRAARSEGGVEAERALASKMLADASLSLEARIPAMRVFCDEVSVDQGSYYKTPRPPTDLSVNQAMRAKYLEEFAADPKLDPGKIIPWGELNSCMWYSRFESVVNIMEPFRKHNKRFGDRECFLYIASLYAIGRTADAVAEAEQFAADPKRPAPARFRAALCAKLLPLTGKDDIRRAYDALWKEYAGEKGMTPSKASESLLYAGKLYMLAKKFDAAKALWNVYESLFVPEPQKVYTLRFSDTPVYNLSQIAALKNQPEKQFLDRKFGGNMDFLVTDVSTGRTAADPNAASKTNKFTEFSALCDENGIHLLFRAYHDRAREAELGLTGGGGYEMYLAPGENQPYTCLLTDQARGTVDLWNTTYPNEHHRRFDAKEPGNFRMEQSYRDDGYDTHLFISWQNFYDKLPEKGDLYEFENCYWSPSGAYSWNGVKVIHGRSSWGKLAFDISPDQRKKIQKKIVLASLPGYRKQAWTGIAHHGEYDRWIDPELGDPAFYKEKVAPLRAELDALAALIKPDMSDADVDKVWSGLPAMRELSYKIAQMRRLWLEEQLSK